MQLQKKVFSLLLVLFLVFTNSGFKPTPLFFDPQPMEDPTPELDYAIAVGDYQIRSELLAALESSLLEIASLSGNATAFGIGYFEEHRSWAWINVLPMNGDHYHPEEISDMFLFFVAKGINNNWRAAYSENNEQYLALLDSIDRTSLSFDEKELLESYYFRNQSRPQLMLAGNLKFPWSSSQNSWRQASGFHDAGFPSLGVEGGAEAVDLIPPDSANPARVIAMESGTVTNRLDCTYNTVLVVRHDGFADTKKFVYHHIQKGTSPTGIGASLTQGTSYLGDLRVPVLNSSTCGPISAPCELDRNPATNNVCSYSNARHLHLGFGTDRSISIDGISVSTFANGRSYNSTQGDSQPPSNCQNYSYNGIVLFNDSQCNGGDKREFNSTGYRNLTDGGINFNDAASSVHIGSGWSVKVWENIDRGEPSRCLTTSMWDLAVDKYDGSNNTMNNSITAIEVFNNSSCSGSSGGTGNWKADYFDTVDRWWDNNNSGNYRCSENLTGPTLDKNYGTGTACGMDPDHWVGEYTATINFPAGNYVFLTEHDDGLKIWLNGNNIGDYGGSGSDKTCPGRYLSGNQNLKVMLREDGGDARVKVWWTTDTSVCTPGTPSLTNPPNNHTVSRNEAVTVSWNGVSGASNYHVYFTGGPGWTVDNWTTSNSMYIGDSFWGGTYTWKVLASSSAGDSPWSETRVLYRKYGTPGAVSSSSIGQTQLTLNWGASSDAPPGNITGYRIFRGGTLIGTTSASTTTYTDTGLSCGTNYSYTVKAYNGSLESDATTAHNVSTASCQASQPQLTSPDNGSVFNEGQAISLAWSKTGDQFYGQISGGPSTTPLTFGWQTATTKDIGSQWAGYTYTWKVKARNTSNYVESAWSDQRTFTVRPSKPGSVTASVQSCSRVNLSWTDNSGNEEGYKVYRNDSLIATLGAGSTTYSDTAPISGSANNYAVYAYRGTILSEAGTASAAPPHCPPDNDNFASATSVGVLPYTRSQSTVGATREAGEPGYPIGNNPGSTVWYRFTPSTDGLYSFDTISSNYDTVVHVFTKSGSTWTLLQGDDDDTLQAVSQSKIILALKAGTTYWISAGHYGLGSGGSLTFNVSSVPCPVDNACVSVTNPSYYAAVSKNVRFYESDGSFGYTSTNSYGIATLLWAEPGRPYTAIISGWNTFFRLDDVVGGSPRGISAAHYPTRQFALLDPQGAMKATDVYILNELGFFYVGQSTETEGLRVYGTTGAYKVIYRDAANLLMAVGETEISAAKTGTPNVYDMSQMPVKTMIFHPGGFHKAFWVMWMGGWSGLSFDVTEGSAVKLSMMPNLAFYSQVIAQHDDSPTTNYWQYGFRTPGYTSTQLFRETVDIWVGGTLQLKATSGRPVYNPGESSWYNYDVRDAYGNSFDEIQYYYRSSTLATEKQSSMNGVRTKAAADVEEALPSEGAAWVRSDGLRMPTEAMPDGSSRLMLAAPPLQVTGKLYNPANQLVMTANESSDFYGGFNYTFPNPTSTGTWRVEFSAPHLGSYQGATTGQASFTVKYSTPPPNDDFGNPTVIGVSAYTDSLDTTGATIAGDDPDLAFCSLLPTRSTVWYRFTPDVSGTLRVDTIGTDYDTVLAVWTGARGRLQPVDCNDDRSYNPHDQDSDLTVAVSAGTTYYIMVGEFNGAPQSSMNNQAAFEKTYSSNQPSLLANAGSLVLHANFSSSLPGKPVLRSPNTTIAVRRPVFQWQPATYATHYNLRVYDAQQKLLLTVPVGGPGNCDGTDCSYYIPFDLADGDYTWQVQAVNSAGASAWTSTLGFTVQSPLPVWHYLFLPSLRR